MSRNYFKSNKNDRQGNILVLSAFLMVFMLALVAFSVDLGYKAVARTELQRSADSAALAASWQLINQEVLQLDPYMADAQSNAHTLATQYASWNVVCNDAPSIDTSANSDVTVGTLSNILDPHLAIDTSDPTTFNTVRVKIRRSPNMNGQVPFFFGPVLGVDGASAQADATAAFYRALEGFQVPNNGGNLEVLPFALDEETWLNLLAGTGGDDWSWNSGSESVVQGGDGVLEVNLYPKGNGSPGNRGTVDIGSNSNSTNDISRQIVDGISPSDMEYHGGTLEFDHCGKLYLNGDTGISAGVKDELASIIGEPRIIPIFRSVDGPGNNATYTIVRWAGIRILDVKLTGNMNSKRVVIQPANVMANGAIPSTNPQASSFVYTRPMLVR